MCEAVCLDRLDREVVFLNRDFVSCLAVTKRDDVFAKSLNYVTHIVELRDDVFVKSLNYVTLVW